ncbi:MAG: ABC transporter ATP-binding protein [Thermodesulfobacteriota bacterium]
MPILDISDLKKSYISPESESTLIIDLPHFQLEEGEHLALEGESGSGKTTFLNLIAGISNPDSGSIVLDGIEMCSLSESDRDSLRANKIGYIFQTFNLLMGYTALENVLLGMMFGNSMDTDKAMSLLERVGLGNRYNYRPGQLSVGQQQRVAVARALANSPKIVLADEPTGNLDKRTSGEALRLIRDICSENNASLLLVSHEQRVLDDFSTVTSLSNINRALQS